MINGKAEFRFEGHYYRWTLIDTFQAIDKDTDTVIEYGLAESSIGDEAPYILFKIKADRIEQKMFTNKRTNEVSQMPFIPADLIVDDEVYDDIITALEDNDILYFKE
jgi:hypothetical protein